MRPADEDPCPPDDPGRRTEEVWGRALLPQPISDLPGDIAVHHALDFHGRVCRGGFLKAVEDALEAGEGHRLDAAEQAYRWLGVEGVADLVSRVREVLARGGARRLRDAERLEVESDRVYLAAVPDDPALEATLRRRVEESPASFSPGGIPPFDWPAYVQQQLRGPWA